MVGLFNVPVFALTEPGNGSDQPNKKFENAKFHLSEIGMVHPDEIIEEGKKFSKNISSEKYISTHFLRMAEAARMVGYF